MIYILTDNQLEVKECIWSNGVDKNGNLLMYHSEDGFMTKDDRAKLPENNSMNWMQR